MCVKHSRRAVLCTVYGSAVSTCSVFLAVFLSFPFFFLQVFEVFPTLFVPVVGTRASLPRVVCALSVAVAVGVLVRTVTAVEPATEQERARSRGCLGYSWVRARACAGFMFCVSVHFL